MSQDSSQNLVERWLSRLKNSPLIAILIIFSIIVVGIGQFTGALNEIIAFVKSDPAASSADGPVDPACTITETRRVRYYDLWNKDGPNDFAPDLDEFAIALQRSECARRFTVLIQAFANLAHLSPHELKELSQDYADDFARALEERGIDEDRIRAVGRGGPVDGQSPSRVEIFLQPQF